MIFLQSTLLLVRRDMLRFVRQPLGYLLALSFFGLQAYLFYLIMHLLAAPVPQTTSPVVFMFSDSILLNLFSFFIPALAMRAYAEERQQGTWDLLLTLGTGRKVLATAKFLSSWFIFIIMQGLCLVLVLALSSVQVVDWGQVFCGWLGLVLLGAYWSSVALLVASRFNSMAMAYLAGACGIFLLRALPFLEGVFPSPLWRPLFEVLDISRVLEQSSNGYLSLSHLVFLLGASVVMVGMTALVLEAERKVGLKQGLAWMRVIMGGMIFGLMLYMCIYIAKHKGIQWNFNGTEPLSAEFRSLLEKFPPGGKLTVILPHQANHRTFPQVRELVLGLCRQAGAAHSNLTFQELDPDIDLREAERLKAMQHWPENVIGGILFTYKNKTLSIPYHHLFVEGQFNRAGQAVPYIRYFRGEEQLATVMNALLRKGDAPKALVMSGLGELDVSSDEGSGGSQFLLMLHQLGIEVERCNPLRSRLPNLEQYQMLLWLDPAQAGSDVHRKLFSEAVAKEIPLLMVRGAHAGQIGQSWQTPTSLGVDWLGKVGVQNRAYPAIADVFTLPVPQSSTHPIMEGFDQQACIFTLCDALSVGISADPRIEVKPMLRTETNRAVWGESEPTTLSADMILQKNDNDVDSPLLLAAIAERLTPGKRAPVMIAVASRAPFENRFIQQGGNRDFAFRCVDWLLHGERRLVIPPRRPDDYALQLSPSQWLAVQGWAFLPLPFLLGILSFWTAWRRR